MLELDLGRLQDQAEPNFPIDGMCVMCNQPIGISPSPVACKPCADYAFDFVGFPRKEDDAVKR
jgi:hypothetical protein